MCNRRDAIRPINVEFGVLIRYVLTVCLPVLDICTICHYQGPVVQSVVSLTSSLRLISFTVLADSRYNILIFFAEKM